MVRAWYVFVSMLACKAWADSGLLGAAVLVFAVGWLCAVLVPD